MNIGLREKLKALVIRAIDNEYLLEWFIDEVKNSVLEAITEGYMFDDYFEYYEFVEDVDPEFYLFSEWILDDYWKVIKKKKGKNFDEEKLKRYYQEKKKAKEEEEAPDSISNMLREAIAEQYAKSQAKADNV